MAAGEPVELAGPPARFVGRGGDKLAGALDGFGIDPTGRSCLDAGSSTGGFTDCLLQRGARRVVAVDVGRGQLHPRLREDARVDVREQTDIRAVDETVLGGPVALVVADLSFIGLRPVLPALVAVAAPDADLVLLVKPQFEAGAAEASRGKGVISDPDVWRRVLIEAMEAVAASGAAMMGAMVSPLRGAAGNVEFFLHASHDGGDLVLPGGGHGSVAGHDGRGGAVSRIGLVVHEAKPEAVDRAATIARWLADRDHEAVRLRPDGDDGVVTPSGLAAEMDLLISLGGDGTMLRTVDVGRPPRRARPRRQRGRPRLSHRGRARGPGAGAGGLLRR